MRSLVLLTLASAMLLPAQEAAKPTETVKPRQTGERYIQRVYPVKHMDVDELVRLVNTIPSGQGQTPVVRSSSALKAITAYGTTSEVESIMANLKALDVPRPDALTTPRTFDLTMYILRAGTQADSAGTPVPESLAGVTKHLRDAFGLTQFSLAEASMLRGSAGDLSNWRGSAGTLGGYAAFFERAQVDRTSSSSSVRLQQFNFELTDRGRMDLRFRTNLELRDGQQVVVGKANIDTSGTSLILVLAAKVDK